MARLYTTSALVLSSLRYRETSLIVKCLTETFGLQSYIVNGVRSAKAHPRMAYYMPLSLLGLVVYHRPGADLNRISQVSFFEPGLLPDGGIEKTTIRLFLSEILNRVLKEEEQNPVLFEFVFTSIRAFEHAEENLQNFHIQFLLRLSNLLGFGLRSATELFNQVHNLGMARTGTIGLAQAQEQEALQSLIELPYFAPIALTAAIRRHLLEILLNFYSRHLDMPPIRSLQVLQEVFA